MEKRQQKRQQKRQRNIKEYTPIYIQYIYINDHKQ